MRVYYNTMPETTIHKMQDYLHNKLLSNDCNIFKYNPSDLEIFGTSEYDWFGNITAEGIVNKKGIKDVKIKSLDSITITTNAFYKDVKIASFIIIYFDDNNIVVPDYEFIVSTMNLSICDSCHKHKDRCSCNKTSSIDKRIKEIMSIVNHSNLSKTTLYDPENLVYEERRVNVIEEPETPKIDLKPYQPILKGICTTLKFKVKDIEAAAIKILTSNPNMPDNQLAAELIRKMRG